VIPNVKIKGKILVKHELPTRPSIGETLTLNGIKGSGRKGDIFHPPHK
jgi:hypothetical protein